MSDSFMQTIINRIRHGEVAALQIFNEHLLQTHPEAKDLKDILIIYAACECLSTDLNELDIVLGKLLHQAILENPQTAEHFQGNNQKALRTGCEQFLRTALFTYHLKKQNITLEHLYNHKGKLDFNGPVKEAYAHEAWHLFAAHVLPKIMQDEPFTPQHQLIDKGINEYIKQQEI